MPRDHSTDAVGARAEATGTGVKNRSEELADELGQLAQAASVQDAVAFAISMGSVGEPIPHVAPLLDAKVVIDPLNPIAFDENGQVVRSLPEGQSAALVAAALLPKNVALRQGVRHPRRGGARSEREPHAA
ncbi:hypothetical protein [Streptomyces sp. NPDC059928]|uniref:hypothetical protein n=1 Tax=unclassified Streptomyces TaxID=2593676 RepID=UPI003650DF7A